MKITLNIPVVDKGPVPVTVNCLSRDDLPSDKTWLWKYVSIDHIGHDMVEGVILSAGTFEEANAVFIEHLLYRTPSYYHHHYAGSKWTAEIEGEDYNPTREEKVLLTDFLHA